MLSLLPSDSKKRSFRRLFDFGCLNFAKEVALRDLCILPLRLKERPLDICVIALAVKAVVLTCSLKYFLLTDRPLLQLPTWPRLEDLDCLRKRSDAVYRSVKFDLEISEVR